MELRSYLEACFAALIGNQIYYQKPRIPYTSFNHLSDNQAFKYVYIILLKKTFIISIHVLLFII